MAAKGKLDSSKQNKAQTYLNGWVSTAQRLRSIAIVVVLAVIAYCILLSIFSPRKYFPRQPSAAEIQKAKVVSAINNFHYPPR